MRNFLTLLVFCFVLSFANAQFTNVQQQYLEFGNLLLNAGFEQGRVSWTVSGSTFTSDNTTSLYGNFSGKISGAAGDLIQNHTTSINYDGITVAAQCSIKTDVVTVELCGLANGTEVICSSIAADSKWHSALVTFAAGTTSIGLKIKKDGIQNVNIDGCFLGILISSGNTLTQDYLWIGNASNTASEALTGTISEAVSSILNITGGLNQTIGNVSIEVNQAGTAQDGYLAAADWNTFNNKMGGSGTDNFVPLFDGTGNLDASAISQTELEVLNGITSVATGAGDNDKIPTKGYVDDSFLSKVLTQNYVWKGSPTNTPTESALGNLTEAVSSILTISGGTNSTIGNVSLEVQQSTTSTDGYLSSTDWNTFNNKFGGSGTDNFVPLFNGTNELDASAISQTELEVLNGITSLATGTGDNDKLVTKGYVDDKGLPSLTQNNIWVGDISNNASAELLGNLSEAVSSILNITGGTSSVRGNISIEVDQSTTSTDGYLSSTDWNTFNNKFGGSGTDNFVPLFNGTNQLDASAISQTELEVLNGISALATGSGDNDKLTTKGYVDDLAGLPALDFNMIWVGNISNTASKTLLGDITEAISSILTITGGSNASIGNVSLEVQQSTTSTDGYLSSTDWNTFNNKFGGSGTDNFVPLFSGTNQLDASAISQTELEILNGITSLATGSTDNDKLVTKGYVDEKGLPSLTQNNVWVGDGTNTASATALGNVSEAVSSILTIIGGTNASIGNVSIEVQQSTTSTDGYLSSTDWNTFNNKFGGSGTDNFVPLFSGTNQLDASAISQTELEILNGITSLATGSTDNDKLVTKGYVDEKGLPSLTQNNVWVGDGTNTASATALGNVSEAVSSILTIIGGTNAAIGNVSLEVQQSTTSTDGYLSSTDWNTFNNKFGGSGTDNFVPLFSGTNQLDASAISQTELEILNGITSLATGSTDNDKLVTKGYVDEKGLPSLTQNNIWVGDGTNTASAELLGNFTEDVSSILSITGGTNAVRGGITVQVNQSSAAQDGYLSTTDWNTFNNKIGGSGTDNFVPLFDGTGNLDASVISQTELEILNGITLLATGSTDNDKLATKGYVDDKDLPSLTQNNIWIGDGTNTASELLTGSLTTTTTGVTIGGTPSNSMLKNVTINIASASSTSTGLLTTTDYNKFSALTPSFQTVRMSNRSGAAIGSYSKSIGYTTVEKDITEGATSLFIYQADSPGDAGAYISMTGTAELTCVLQGSEDSTNMAFGLIINGAYNQNIANNNITYRGCVTATYTADAIMSCSMTRLLIAGDFVAPVFSENTGGNTNGDHSLECTARSIP